MAASKEQQAWVSLGAKIRGKLSELLDSPRTVDEMEQIICAGRNAMSLDQEAAAYDDDLEKYREKNPYKD